MVYTANVCWVSAYQHALSLGHDAGYHRIGCIKLLRNWFNSDAKLCGSDAKLSFYERVLLGQVIENLESVLSLLETVVIAFV